MLATPRDQGVTPQQAEGPAVQATAPKLKNDMNADAAWRCVVGESAKKCFAALNFARLCR